MVSQVVVRRVMGVAALGVALVGAGAAAGVAVGEHRASDVHMTTGRADASGSTISVVTSSWTYAVSPVVDWRDADGTEHFGGRPSCIPELGAATLRIGWVAYRADGATQRQVVEIDCDS